VGPAIKASWEGGKHFPHISLPVGVPKRNLLMDYISWLGHQIPKKGNIDGLCKQRLWLQKFRKIPKKLIKLPKKEI
jgi:hypothetical protein